MMHNGPLTDKDRRELYKGMIQGVLVIPILYPILIILFTL